jgi:hypothetical protein
LAKSLNNQPGFDTFGFRFHIYVTMQFSFFLQAFVVAIIAQLSDAEWVEPTDWPTSIYSLTDAAQIKSLASRGSKFLATLTTQPAFSSFTSVIATAVPLTYGADFALTVDGRLLSDSWVRALPTEARSYWYSLAKEQDAFFTSGTTSGKTMGTGSSVSTPAGTGTSLAGTSVKNSGGVLSEDLTRSTKIVGIMLITGVSLLILV